jgi:hypothetical protein
VACPVPRNRSLATVSIGWTCVDGRGYANFVLHCLFPSLHAIQYCFCFSSCPCIAAVSTLSKDFFTHERDEATITPKTKKKDDERKGNLFLVLQYNQSLKGFWFIKQED